MKIEFFRHNISKKDIDNTVKALKDNFLTTGKITEDFEKKFSEYLGIKYAIGLTSCTGALHLSLEIFGIGQGDEVITTPLSFIASANAILQAGATPVFVDVEPETGNIDADLIEKAITKRAKAIMPVHLYGHMVDMKKIKKIADKHNLKIIEDTAHCIEGERDGIRPGQLGDTACFSFYATKSITCGEGGAVALNNKKIAEKLKKMRIHGLEKSAYDRYDKKFSHYDMDVFGWKYNMDNIQAALLLNQLDQIEKLWKRRKEICQKYEKAFSNSSVIDFPKTLASVKHARHLFTLWVNPQKRTKIINKLKQKGIPTVINYYPPVHLMTYYRKKYGYRPGDFPNAEKISEKTITLPLYPKLKNKEISYIIKITKQVLKHV